MVRDPAGTWRYVDTWVAVPGAREVTLTERYSPKFVVNAENQVERVVVDGSAIESAPDLLGWCLQAGTALREGEKIVEVLVPFELWEERDRIPNELFSPEHQGDEAEREVAAAERRYREMERRFELAARARTAALQRRARDMTRQKAREITGLSVGRVQQLISSEAVDMAETRVLELFESAPIPSFDACLEMAREKDLPLDKDALWKQVESLKDRELLEEVEDSEEVYLTNRGAAVLLAARMLEQQVERGG